MKAFITRSFTQTGEIIMESFMNGLQINLEKVDSTEEDVTLCYKIIYEQDNLKVNENGKLDYDHGKYNLHAKVSFNYIIKISLPILINTRNGNFIQLHEYNNDYQQIYNFEIEKLDIRCPSEILKTVREDLIKCVPKWVKVSSTLSYSVDDHKNEYLVFTD